MNNYIFDIGNVLLSYEPLPFLEAHFQHPDDLFKLIAQSKEWLMLDEGTLTYEEAINRFIKRRSDLATEIKDYMESWPELLKPIKENIEVMEALKKDHSVYLLSNFHKEAFIKVSNTYDFLKNVDGQVVSAFVHLLKPDKRIYETLCETYHLDPHDCVFIDDSLPNIETARTLGMKGIHMVKGLDLKEAIKNL
jgi:putative hydrolase of the HAD superfamily